jgi:dipeptidyl aminopeptidase/acylaminoacyl peptidase
MVKRLIILFLLLLAVLFNACKEHKANRIPIRDFFKTPEETLFKISPDGQYISYLKPYQGKQNIVIKSLTDGRERLATSFKDYPVRDYWWTYNNQLVFNQDIVQSDQLKMFAMDTKTLTARNILTLNNVRTRLLSRNRKDPDIITIVLNKQNPANFDVYRLNIRTGEFKPYLINPGNFTDWYPDIDGSIRLVKASDGVNETILYRKDEHAPFKKIIENNFKNSVDPIAFAGNKNYFYAISNVNRDKAALVEINAENGQEQRVIFASDQADITRVDYSRNKRCLELASWEDAKPEKHFLSNNIAQLYTKISRLLKGNEINIVDRDSAETKFVINTYTDRNPGVFYLYDNVKDKLTKLGDINSSVKPGELCEMKPIAYKSRDGLTINGYLTLPLGSKTSNFPVVVMPHNGPWSRDHWRYSDEVQFLANRGYAVFQMNYRGSKGYGKAFYSAGFKQVGGKIQDDITDGVHWLIDQKIANPGKIAIFGGGFGGFSALYGVSFNQGLYNCAVVQYGLINFFTYIKDAPPFAKPYLKMTYEMVGNPETDADMLRAISPVFHTDKIKVPLLIFQGAKDLSANISELNQYVRQLKNSKVSVKYFLKPDERKFFRNEHNRMEMYTEIGQFLDKNMGVRP